MKRGGNICKKVWWGGFIRLNDRMIKKGLAASPPRMLASLRHNRKKYKYNQKDCN